MPDMGVIEVNGIRVYAYHGCLAEEGRIGGQYRVDIRVEGDFTQAERSDELKDTVDYGRVTAIVKQQMAERSKLIEHVAHRILTALKQEWTADLPVVRPPGEGTSARGRRSGPCGVRAGRVTGITLSSRSLLVAWPSG